MRILEGKAETSLEQLIKTVILGIIQGLTEWLPISSTGHLKVAEHFLNFGTQNYLLFDFILHIGTLIVVLFFFRREIGNMLEALSRLDFKTEHGKLIPPVIVGTIPAAVIGILLKETVEQTFTNFLSIAVVFIVFGFILYSAKFGMEKTDNINYSAAIIIGVAEGLAILPGFSRSGATITVALLLGIKREKAFQFSFLLSIPAIIGAAGYSAYKDYGKLLSTGLGWSEILAGVIPAMCIGYFAIKLLWKILCKQKLHFFAFYCWFLGAVLIMLWLSDF
ncbi:MAG: undecaprenyl-diphosphate phosphatase [Candidatus Bathyarchaeia archaeon]